MELDSRFDKPENWHWDLTEAKPGDIIRYGYAVPSDPAGVVYIGQGGNEYAEKYFETIRTLLLHNLAVVTWDWRGQGESRRHYDDKHKRYHDGAGRDVADMLAVIAAAEKNAPVLKKQDRIYLGHSMGGLLGLHAMHKHPQLFKRAVLSSPLCDLGYSPAVYAFAQTLTAAVPFGFGGLYAPGMGPWNADKMEKGFAEMTLSTPHRDMQRYWMHKHPHLRMGGYTLSMLDAMLKATAKTVDPNWLSGIATPMRIIAGSEERAVSLPAIRAAAKRLPNATYHEVKGGLHELMMEREPLRREFWDHALRFILSGPATLVRLRPARPVPSPS